MRYVECSTQAELDAVAPEDIAIVRTGRFVARGSSHVVARGSSHVEARGSSHVVAWGSSHVVAWGSSHVVARESSHVEAWESSHVVAWGSSHVVAWGSSHVEAWGSSHVEATKFVAIHRHASTWGTPTVKGGVIIDVKIETPQDWCELYGIKVTRGKAVLFKAVESDWRGGHKVTAITYRPGDKPVALDFEPSANCGYGLHLSSHPRRAKDYCSQAVHFLACEVKVADIIVIDDKVKVPTCKVLHEVTIDGEPVPA